MNYSFTKNDPFDLEAPIQLAVEQRMSSNEYMQSIRNFEVPDKSVAFWFLGQNCFVFRGSGSDAPLIAIDPYLTDSCGQKDRVAPYRANRQLPVFIEPEDLDVDLVICTHSHDDHTDPETIRRLNQDRVRLAGPYQSIKRFEECGVPAAHAILLHPHEVIDFRGVKITGTFAMPTDDSDLNHMGFIFEFPGGVRYYNSGDTAYTELLRYIGKWDIDVCSICINGGYLNLSHFDAARIVKEIAPKVVIPCHYDMMVHNVGDPRMFHSSLQIVRAESKFHMMDYYEPWVYSP